MTLEVSDIVKYYQRDRDAKKATLDERIPDLHFARWSQNDDLMSEVATTEFKGQFDIISRERRRIKAELRQNEIEVKFRNKKDDDDDADDILQGKYRTDRRISKSKQCFNIAQEDQIDVGFGAWRLVTEEEDELDTLSTNLEIRREAIPEAVRRVFYDANAKLLDKSDATCCSVITSFTQEGYIRALEEMGIDKDKMKFTSFDDPYQSIYEVVCPGIGLRYPFFAKGDNKINLLEFYNLEPKREMWCLFQDEFGNPFSMPEKEANKQGLTDPVRKKKITKVECWKYITNGVEIIKRSKVPGGKIPVVPVYGEVNFINETENHFGIVKAARDPQNLYNSVLNYLASMMMFSPVPRPDFDPMEIEGVEEYHEGSANSHTQAYTLRNKYYVDDDGHEYNFSNPTYTQPPTIPPAVAALMATLPALTDSILNPGVTEDAFDTSASGVALDKIIEQMGIQEYIYIDNYAEAMRRDGEVYAAMASEVFDNERKIIVTNADGTTTDEVINREEIDYSVFDEETYTFGMNVHNKIAGKRFDVHFDVGPSYKTKRDAVLQTLKELFQSLPDGHPAKEVVMMTILSKQTGEGMDEINKFARFNLLSQGLPGFEPQTNEEVEYIQGLMAQQQAEGQPDAAEVLLAEQVKTERINAESGARKDRADIILKEAQAREKNADAEAQEIENFLVKNGMQELLDKLGELSNGQTI